FGLFGWLLRRAIADGIRSETDQRQKLLNRSDTDELLALANEEPRNFSAGGEELLAASLEAPTFWSKLFRHGFECRGLLRLRHRTRGEFTLEFLGQQVLREAIEWLPSVLGDRLQVRLSWNRLKGCYV